MAVQKQPPKIIELDLDATDELPVLDFDAVSAMEAARTQDVQALPDPTAATDVFPAPVIPAGVVDLSDSLREVEQRLARKIERVGKLEADMVAAQLRIDELKVERDEARRTGAQRESALQAELGAAAQGNNNLKDELARQQLNHERDLADLRRRSERQHEALSTWQGFRAVSDARLAESEAQIDGIDARHAAAMQEAAAQRSQLQDELTAARQQAAAQIAALEQSLKVAAQAQINSIDANHAAAMQEAVAQRGQLQDELTAARQQAAEQIAALEQSLRDATQTEQSIAAELQEAMARISSKDGELAASHESLQDAMAQRGQLQDELTAAREQAAAQIAALEQSLKDAAQTQQSTAAELQDALARVASIGDELAASHESLAGLQQQLDELRALEDKARAGAEQFDEHQRQIAVLQAEVEAAAERERDAEAALRKANERMQRLEADAHASAAVMGNLQQSMQRLSRDDTGTRPAPQPAAGLTVLRVLIRQEGGSDIVYPLSRRTSIGRTPDNDIQVDASWISRHHAVLLSSADHCIVEDLNSTNGVLVNGRRVSRQILHDGDAVTVGKTEFRYQQRS